MCLVGPHGVGKTSLGKSVAKATGREFIRISLGGVRDESEIRGHRRTYIGSMPGKIIQALKKAKTTNPLILLDEIDKMGQDFRGDPASAMLEVLDPEQNATFVDHYLEVEYDLSDVMFLTTSNSYNMPGPLLDRMEIIPLAGYTEEEKAEIAHRHLIPKQVKNHGLKASEFALEPEALQEIPAPLQALMHKWAATAWFLARRAYASGTWASRLPPPPLAHHRAERHAHRLINQHLHRRPHS